MRTIVKAKQILTAIIDTREQMPLDLQPLATVRGTLKTGDYSLQGYEEKVSIERKSLDDFIQCCTYQRERFERELDRLREFTYKAIVVESTWSAIELKQYRGASHPNSILGSAMGFALSANVPIIMAGSHATAGKLVARLLWVSGNRLLRHAKTQAASPLPQPIPPEDPLTCTIQEQSEYLAHQLVQNERAQT